MPDGSRVEVSVGDVRNGYPCPKDGTTLTLLDGGAWCPECQTVWAEIGEVSLRDLDRLDETDE
jgi:uncharacterized Zn finger protein (UPF0148 family)